MLKAVIIDDETPARQGLINLVSRYCTFVEVIGEANSVESGYMEIINKNPDVVLLDVSMPPSDGFQLLRMFNGIIPFEVIITTAYDNYAIQAIKYAALDYLLKPIDPTELIQAFDRVRKKIANGANPGPKPADQSINKIIVPVDKSMLFVAPDEIVRVEALDRKLAIILKSGKRIESTKNLQDIETALQKFAFFRSHRQHIINLKEIVEYIPDKNGGCVIMTDQKLIPIALRRRDEFLRQFELTGNISNNTQEP